ncbi:MAG: TIGR03668 family PPOX class F420-dependent oxidoreductase [Dehalococcoidia bacterium]
MITQEQADFLDQQRVGRLATVDSAGRPHAVPICFALLDGVIYTPIDEKPKRETGKPLRRVRNILAHPDVCLVVDVYDEDWSRLRWLQVRGVATLVEDAGERERGIAALRAKYEQYRAMDLESRALIGVVVREVVGWGAT